MAETRDDELKDDDTSPLPASVAQCPLFLLPREIRDRVYSFCLTSQNGQQVEWPSAMKSYTTQPQLLRTCKIIYDEAGPLLYSLNALTFHHPSDANMFVRAIASQPMAQHTTRVNLHIKAQETSLWTRYLSSRDPIRSLKCDFPGLRELQVKYRSNKWSHTQTPHSNMKTWSYDENLDQLINGFREVFLPDGPAGGFLNINNGTDIPLSPTDTEMNAWLANPLPASPTPADLRCQHHWLKVQRRLAATPPAPTIRIICTCRVHVTHFAALTTPPHPGAVDLMRLHNANATPLVHPPNESSLLHLGQRLGDDVFSPIPPVKEGEPFRGFTPVDLRAGLKRLFDPELGWANVAVTPFANRSGVLLALEIHSLEGRGRENAAAAVGG
ncbi:hypothetical protein BDY17DRAFT_312687 [Neohortaea acidophila]|uniref:Uncharacterized protein n=1 Tax=Neohortaea acidophila TaxID=245834 RepID=A0A6A6PLR1_9PEZI|nr:uncharacterized protein BDY17DRAFT_312687 [Neohortaea acidophila]KAF2480875.1 hypothetical protein BDY17DRAFT_312687 [Neohortaea acidophila]